MTKAEQPRVRHELTDNLKLSHLTIDPDVQRQLRPLHVESILAAFNPDALGVITCSWRDIKTDLLYVIDGQHRVEVMRRVGYTGPVRAHVYYGLTLPEEAALFRMLNSAKKPSHADVFLVRCTEGDPLAIAAVKALADYDWRISPSSANASDVFSATASLERCWIVDEIATRTAIRVLTNGFGHVVNALQGTLLHGMTLVVHRYGKAFNEETMVKALAGRSSLMGPDAIIAEARTLHGMLGGTAPMAMARVLVKDYNRHTRIAKLEEF